MSDKAPIRLTREQVFGGDYQAIWNAHNATTVQAVSIEQIQRVMDEFKKVEQENNACMVEALNAHIKASGEPLVIWAERLNVDFVNFVRVLSGWRQPDGYFWDQIKRVFEPLRPKEKG